MGAVNISIAQGMNRSAADTFGTTVLVGQGYAISGGAQLNTAYPLNRIEDAEAIGITKANDIANGILVWYHLSEFFRFANGAKAYLYMTNLAMAAVADKDSGPLTALLRTLSPGAVILAFFKTQVGAPTLTDGLDADSIDTIAKAQALCEAQRVMNRPCIAFVDGQSFTGTTANAGNLRAQLARWVSVVNAQDLDMAALHANFATHAAVGTAAGLKAGGKVNRNIGYVAECNILDRGLGRWLRPGLSSNLPLSNYNDHPVSGDFKALHDKGHCVIQMYTDYPGVYFFGDPTCAALTDDFYRAGNSHAYCKAHKLVYQAVLPLVNADVLIDQDTGKLSPVTCAQYENAGNEALELMKRTREISGYKTYCNPSQDVLNNDSVTVEFEIVPTGNAGTINGVVKFVKKLSA